MREFFFYFYINSLSTPLDGTFINYNSPYVARHKSCARDPIKFQLNEGEKSLLRGGIEKLCPLRKIFTTV